MTAPEPAPGISKRASFSDRLTPGQIQAVLDALGIEWREHYNPENDGWVNCPAEGFNSDLSVNIFHGGYVDQYDASHDLDDAKGDVVRLVSLLEETEDKSSISWIKKTLNMKPGEPPPEAPEGFQFANQYLGNEKYVRMPRDILHSNLKPTEKLVWLEIFDRVGKDEVYSFAGIRNIAERLGIGKMTVQRALESLEKHGLLIQRPARLGQKSQRFPLVAEVDTINKRIGEAAAQRTTERQQKNLVTYSATTSNNSDHKKTDSRRTADGGGVPKMSTGCAQNGYTGVLKMGTERDPLNETQLTIHKKQVVQPAAAPSFSSLFFLTVQDNIQRYDHYLSGSLSYEQVASFTSSPNGWNPYTGEHFDSRGYPAAWDEVLPPEPREMIRIESQEADNGTSM